MCRRKNAELVPRFLLDSWRKYALLFPVSLTDLPQRRVWSPTSGAGQQAGAGSRGSSQEQEQQQDFRITELQESEDLSTDYTDYTD
jgi:hypothetical protein